MVLLEAEVRHVRYRRQECFPRGEVSATQALMVATWLVHVSVG